MWDCSMNLVCVIEHFLKPPPPPMGWKCKTFFFIFLPRLPPLHDECKGEWRHSRWKSRHSEVDLEEKGLSCHAKCQMAQSIKPSLSWLTKYKLTIRQNWFLSIGRWQTEYKTIPNESIRCSVPFAFLYYLFFIFM